MLLEEEVRGIIRKEVAGIFNKNEPEIRDEQNFEKDLKADSLDVVELTMNIETAIEVKYKIEKFNITEERYNGIKTVRDLTACVVDILKNNYPNKI